MKRIIVFLLSLSLTLAGLHFFNKKAFAEGPKPYRGLLLYEWNMVGYECSGGYYMWCRCEPFPGSPYTCCVHDQIPCPYPE